MSSDIVAILYLISALLFIFALKGLSHPESSRMGNIFGIIGMIVAIITTLMFKSVLSYTEICVAILIGGLIGAFIALNAIIAYIIYTLFRKIGVFGNNQITTEA